MTRWSALQGTAFALIAGLVLIVPWLNPFAPGPSPATVPWAVAFAATACLILLMLLRAILRKATGNGPFAQRWIYPAAWAWVLAGAFNSTIALLQYFGAAAALSPWVNQAPLSEAFANLRQRNQFASLTNIALVALVWLVVKNGSAGRRQWVLWVVAGLLAAGNAASSSRTGLLQLVLLCVLCLLWPGWHQPPVRRVLLTAVLAYGAAALALPWLAGLDLLGHGMVARLRAGDAVCAGRLTLWSNVWHLIAQKPWFGWGWGELDYAHYMTLYPGARFCDILDNAHNLPLHLAVELGIPLALAVCVGAGWVVWHTKPWRETDPTRQMAWGVLAVIMLHSMLEYPLWYGPFQMAFGLCVWILWPAPREPAAGSRPYARAAAAIRLVVATALLAGVAYAAWDYHRVSQLYLAPQARDAAYRDDTLDKVRGSWLFWNQVQFAELTTTTLKHDNAQWTFDTASALLHYSPEPRVIEKVIESAVMLGRDDEALLHLVRYRAAFPGDYAKWRPANGPNGWPAN
ncbi:Wzy polymerase domain-containing protein [Polaromonas sp.]|uniref:PglL family O-oligosaccharyltransferase n=1 Tax=Polaromonas sp. TaxID=1869339 RepID=UPI00248A20AE|nr:Wzy polymerase domain-containing protein [Polaromonas sp.]MDI1272055.1 Wzy polymerase domain-containing protein [Polaromonas sp.]